MLSKAAQRRRLSQGSAVGMIDGDCSSNSRSRSICVLRLSGGAGSSCRNARSLSPISWTIARLCLESMSMRLRITKPRSGKAPALASPLPQLSRLRARLAILNGTGDRRFWLSARALLLRTAGPAVGTFGYRDMRRVVNGERRSRATKALTGAFVP